MKRFILSMAMVASLAFIGCSDEEEDSSCKTCNEESVTLEICDNNDGTISLVASVSGVEVFNEEIETDEKLSDFSCDDFDFSDFLLVANQ